MEQSKNMEQAGAASAVPTEKKNESRKREVSGKDAQVIRVFLESVGIYEADALRVSIAIADGKATAESISAADGRQRTGTSVEPCVQVVGACNGVLRQAAVGDGQQGVAFHCGKRHGHQPCRIEP